MKKLLYLLPFILIGLSLTPFALYKDTVKYGSSLDTLSPSHWKVLDMQISFSGSLDTAQEVDPNEPLPEPEPVSKNATFKGFPFGAYFSRSESSSNGNFNASGYSWLWGGIDLLLIIVSLVVSFKVNRKKKEMTPVSQPAVAQPLASSNTVTPQTSEVQSGVFSPTQSPQQTVQPSSQTSPQSSSDPQQTPPQV
mgnify:CR=1 FL=1